MAENTSKSNKQSKDAMERNQQGTMMAGYQSHNLKDTCIPRSNDHIKDKGSSLPKYIVHEHEPINTSGQNNDEIYSLMLPAGGYKPSMSLDMEEEINPDYGYTVPPADDYEHSISQSMGDETDPGGGYTVPPADDYEHSISQSMGDETDPGGGYTVPPADGYEHSISHSMEDETNPGGGALPVPPDGGYGWVITIAAFFVSFLIDGLCFSFGFFFLEFLDHFQESKEKTSWTGSVLTGMYATIGPVVGALVNKFGGRKIAIIGSVLSSASLILSTFSPNIYILIITYGVMTGTGFGLLYLPSIVMVGFYFEKRRALATGIAVCGSGIGSFVFAPVCEKLIEVYGWRGATWIIAGLFLNGIVCGVLFKPIDVKCKIKEERFETGKIDDDELKCDKSTVSLDHPMHDGKPGLQYSEMSTGEPHAEVIPMFKCSDTNMIALHSSRFISQTTVCDGGKNNIEDLNRPLYRKDIFYSGSIPQLFKNSSNMDNYVRSNTSLPDKKPDFQKKTSRSKALTDVLKEMMDFTLLKNPVFFVYGSSCFLVSIGFFVPINYLPDMAITLGLERSQAAFLISIIGIANTGARILCGWISDQSWADCLLINNGALVVGGVATILCPFCTSYALLAIYSAVFGSAIAVFVSLRSIIMVELLGLEKLTTAFGLVLLCQGLSTFIGVPIAGFLYDVTQSYNWSFYVAGTTIALSGVICFPLRRIALCMANNAE